MRSTANAARSGYRSPPSVSTSNLIVDGRARLRRAARRGGDGMYVTDVAGLHRASTRSRGRSSVGATGRAISGGELAEPADEFTIASTCPRCWPQSAQLA